MFWIPSSFHTRRGYPDYIVMKDGKIFGFIEVKPRASKELRKGQELFRQLCESYNIPFARWSPDEELPQWL